ncbi:hypothetical protein ACJMK2_000604 [Sinanodonta woodiana]|uniref:TIR domain-containing protein n=1 Tax=Sinanodonta woodiana TaxID=1069815 RepID=A0ABD3XPT5_SINWO
MAFGMKGIQTSLISNASETFDRQGKVWRLIMYVSILLTVLSTCEANSTCTVNGIHYICKNIATKTDFPLVIPTNIRKVTLMGTNELASFPGERFNHPTWANVLELSILEFTNIEHIKEGFLIGLEQLKFLSISSCTYLYEIDQGIFLSTPNVEALHLDGDTRLNLSRVETALTDKLINLRYLSLIGIKAVKQHVVLEDTFLRALRGKNLTYLDISRVKSIIIKQAIVQELLANLKYLNLSYSAPALPTEMNIDASFLSQNIEVFDLTGMQYTMLNYLIKGGERRIQNTDIPKATYVFIQGVNNPDTPVSVNVRLRFKNCGIKVPKMLDVSKSGLKHLNISYIGICLGHELETLNLASNNMEYISQDVLSIFPSLQIIDLSNNHLNNMQDMEDFSNTFTKNKDLEIVFLRNNHLTFVPSNLFFYNSKLRIIDLSENELVYFNLNLYSAENLMLIDLRRNRLKSFSASMMVQFEELRWKQNTKNSTKTYVTTVLLKQFQDKNLIGKRYRYGYNASEDIEFEESQSSIQQYVMINILENRFVCDCDTLVFMEWILFKTIDIINKTLLSCKYGNNEKMLNNELLQMLQTDCQLASSISIGVASSIAIIISIFTFAITIRLRRKSDRRNQDFDNLKQEILKENIHFESLVFLSYCSRDAQIVDENILPSLNRYIHETFNTERDLVCTGENDFVPGLLIIEEIHRCINKSLVVVPVITPEFLQSDWSQEECVAAVERHKRVVILMKRHTNTSGATVTIQHLIGQYTRGTWSDNGGVFDIRPSWNTICEGIIRTASEAFREYRRQHLIKPAEENLLLEDIV